MRRRVWIIAGVALLSCVLAYVALGCIGYSSLDHAYHALRPGMSRATVRGIIHGCTERPVSNGEHVSHFVQSPQLGAVYAYDWMGPLYFDMSIIVAYDKHGRAVSIGETFD